MIIEIKLLQSFKHLTISRNLVLYTLHLLPFCFEVLDVQPLLGPSYYRKVFRLAIMRQEGVVDIESRMKSIQVQK